MISESQMKSIKFNGIRDALISQINMRLATIEIKCDQIKNRIVNTMDHLKEIKSCCDEMEQIYDELGVLAVQISDVRPLMSKKSPTCEECHCVGTHLESCSKFGSSEF